MRTGCKSFKTVRKTSEKTGAKPVKNWLWACQKPAVNQGKTSSKKETNKFKTQLKPDENF
jgi:hypothetical protein